MIKINVNIIKYNYFNLLLQSKIVLNYVVNLIN